MNHHLASSCGGAPTKLAGHGFTVNPTVNPWPASAALSPAMLFAVEGGA